MKNPVEDAEIADEVARIHRKIVGEVVAACESAALTSLSNVASDGSGDTIYAVDRVSEVAMLELFADLARRAGGIVLVAEGLESGPVVLPEGTRASDAALRVIVDPIDGTRGLMYQKRSAWVLTGVAPNRGEETRLSDVRVAVQTEIPLVKQHLFDQLVAIRGRGVRAIRVDRVSGGSAEIVPGPSRETTLLHGFATVSRFFPGARDVLSAVDEELMRAVLGPPRPGKAQCFEDQYISTGGQLHELSVGHDRFVADLRPLVPAGRTGGGPLLCAHPYDLAAALVATELGVVLLAPDGSPLDAPLDVDTNVAWVGYANAALRDRIQPALGDVLVRHGLLRR